MTVQALGENRRGRVAEWLVRYAALIALIAVLIAFSAAIPTFPTPQNLTSVLVNNFALLAIVSIGMTMVVAAGGIDLSVGTAVDFSSLASCSGRGQLRAQAGGGAATGPPAAAEKPTPYKMIGITATAD